MSVLSICSNVLSITGWPVPSTIAANTDLTAKQIFSLANEELRALSELFSWPQLEVEYSTTITANSTLMFWPSDFRVMAPQSVFFKDEYYELRGSTGMQFWELLKYGKLGSLSRVRFRVVYPLGSPGIEVTPTPTNDMNIVAVYYSNKYAKDINGNSLPIFQNDTDTAKIPERYIELGVKWRFRRAKGLDFSAELAEYNNTIQTQYAKYINQGEIRVGGPRPLGYEYAGLTPGFVPYMGFGE